MRSPYWVLAWSLKYVSVTGIEVLCEAYKVGWDFVIVPEQQPPSTKSAALHTGIDHSCFKFYLYCIVIALFYKWEQMH